MMPARGRRRPRRAARHARAAEPRAGDATRSSATGWPSSREPSSSELDRDIVRLARRDWERARRVPEELAAELARAERRGSGELAARRGRADDFAAFAPGARAQRRARPGVRRTAWPRRAQSAVRGAARRLRLRPAHRGAAPAVRGARRGAAAAGGRGRTRAPRRGRWRCRWRRSRRRWRASLAGSGSSDASWRVDVSAHPFTAWIGRRDTRMTTRYSDGDVESLLSSLHEYGHALYERQIDPALERTNLGRGTSMSVHESQSKLWENHVARSAAFARGAGGRAGRRRLRDRARGAARDARRRRALADPRLGRPAHLPAAHHPALRARARADRGRARGRGPAGRLARGRAPAARPGGPLRRARLPAGRPLGSRQLRLLPQLRARLPDRRTAVGGDRGRARPARARTCARGEVGAIQALARRARAPPRAAPGHDPARRAARPARRWRSTPFLRYVAPLAQPRP